MELLSSRREIREKLERIRKGIHLIAHSDKHHKNIKSLPCQYKLEVKLTFSCQCSKSNNTVTEGWGVGSGWRLLSRILPPYRHPRTRLCLPHLLIPRSSDWTVSGFLAVTLPPARATTLTTKLLRSRPSCQKPMTRAKLVFVLLLQCLSQIIVESKNTFNLILEQTKTNRAFVFLKI